jgi:hypothetical protein
MVFWPLGGLVAAGVLIVRLWRKPGLAIWFWIGTRPPLGRVEAGKRGFAPRIADRTRPKQIDPRYYLPFGYGNKNGQRQSDRRNSVPGDA